MFENFLICIQAVLPMFILLAIGYTVRALKLVNDRETAKMNSLAFKILFPFLMFTNVYGSDISESVNIKLIVFTLGGIGAVYLCATIFSICFEKEPTSRGAMIQAIYRSNFVIMGVPLANNIYGHGNIGTTAIMVAIVVPVYNIIAVITLEMYRKEKIKVWTIVKRIITNPLIIGAIAGIVCALIKVQIPELIDTTIDDLSKCATPIAILILGASFQFSSVKNHMRNLTVCVIARLIIVPGVVLTVAALLGFTGIQFITLVAVFASPCAVSSYTMARELNSDYKLAGNTVVFTSALCCLTMFIWLFIFKSMGVFSFNNSYIIQSRYLAFAR